MATKDSIMKQSIFFWVFGHRLSFEYGLKKFLFGAWRNLSGALRELILRCSDETDVRTSQKTTYAQFKIYRTTFIDEIGPWSGSYTSSAMAAE